MECLTGINYVMYQCFVRSKMYIESCIEWSTSIVGQLKNLTLNLVLSDQPLL